MYRHTAAFGMGATIRGSPGLDEQSASESESETIAELDQKRRQLDEEIALFKTQKEREFREFEHELRRKRKRKRSPVNGEHQPSPSVLSLLASRPQINGHTDRPGQQHVSRPNSKPTLSVEKLTIIGTTVLPVAAEDPPSVLARSLTGTTTPPCTRNEKAAHLPHSLSPFPQNHDKQESPPTPIARDHDDSFAGVFTPTYLPLLDSRSSSTASIPLAQTQQTQAPHLDPSPIPQPGSESSSLPSSPISPRIPSPAKRSYTAPPLPSTSLPSALRTSDLKHSKKHKHVMFQLADSAVVEPSSSYEEMSSPDLPWPSSSTGKTTATAKTNSIDSMLGAEEIPWSWSKGPTSPIVEKGNAMNLCGDGEGEDHDHRTRPAVFTPRSASAADTAVPAAGLAFDAAADGGSGVGFFELEEELDSPSMSPGLSPRLRSPRSGRRFFDDWGALPDEEEEEEEEEEVEEEDEEMTADDGRFTDKRGDETRSAEEDLAEEIEIGSRGLGISGSLDERGHGHGYGPPTNSTFASGSVPIDIVMRPSSGWVGNISGSQSQPRGSEYVP